MKQSVNQDFIFCPRCHCRMRNTIKGVNAVNVRISCKCGGVRLLNPTKAHEGMSVSEDGIKAPSWVIEKMKAIKELN